VRATEYQLRARPRGSKRGDRRTEKYRQKSPERPPARLRRSNGGNYPIETVGNRHRQYHSVPYTYLYWNGMARGVDTLNRRRGKRNTR
jgi:hypothetical protein